MSWFDVARLAIAYFTVGLLLAPIYGRLLPEDDEAGVGMFILCWPVLVVAGVAFLAVWIIPKLLGRLCRFMWR